MAAFFVGEHDDRQRPVRAGGGPGQAGGRGRAAARRRSSTWPRSSWPPAGRDAAAASATEGLRLARETGNDTSACRHLATLAHLAALRGDEDACRASAAEALERAAARGLGLPATLAGTPSGCSSWGRAGPAEALARFQRLLAAGPGAGSPFFAVYTVPDLVEAAVRSGQPEAAAAPLAAFGQLAAAAGTPEVLAQLARCRGLVGPDEEAAAQFEEALALHDGQGRPFDLARTELAYGEALRRARRRGEARTHLRRALETFQRLGAAPWAERAGAELRATGETARKRDPSTLGQLTPQELQIIRLVGEGGTNREIGAQLFLSRRTIDYHLRNVFVKLGVSSRAELIRAGPGRPVTTPIRRPGPPADARGAASPAPQEVPDEHLGQQAVRAGGRQAGCATPTR